ncbi:hypothetical protein SJ05684_c06050 [Sinorhizobium sojae CCBAU 05684]|uniref:Uncharacterized protein n=1 Tax=Sinorhizobium sojae CCBAU 05684 TaxID=716928 RepID=A0A249P9X5_9HYPH|nr:hypothetical protein SJ05684_c06050 [Sinorhizobium sojae CCBAU 05684]
MTQVAAKRRLTIAFVRRNISTASSHSGVRGHPADKLLA